MNISDFQQCANCGACYNACPKGAISVYKEGTFYIPTVDTERCVDCSLCVRVCPVNQTIHGSEPIRAFSGWHMDSRVVLDSSSGGVFYGLAQAVLAEGGVVFSAVYAKDFRTVEFASSDDVPLHQMLKSKYVESLVGLSFQKIKDELKTGRRVLFCGTPCQVAGLRTYLSKDYDKLLTCDFACGGLPSHRIYQEYLQKLERKHRSTVQSVDFRPKTHGWMHHALQVKLTNGKEYLRLGSEDPYLGSFLYGKLTVRDYCLDCKFPECHLSDISIADFWLYEKLSSLQHEDGISLILCNTAKGVEAIHSIHQDYELFEQDVNSASYNNHVKVSQKKKEKRSAFLRCYEESGLKAAYQKYLPASPITKVKNRIRRLILRKKRKA